MTIKTCFPGKVLLLPIEAHGGGLVVVLMVANDHHSRMKMKWW